ncbi:hypothetical protein OAG73_00565 [bacterium]|nr:hypothetical protein [bacterium]
MTELQIRRQLEAEELIAEQNKNAGSSLPDQAKLKNKIYAANSFVFSAESSILRAFAA